MNMATLPGVDFGRYESQYGLPTGYLGRTSWLESRGDVNAKNPNSSAAGPFQFITSTARQYGLENPYDADESTDAASRLGRDNMQFLRSRLGRDPTAAELYLAHQQGAGGAAGLLANPNRPAHEVVGMDAVKLNGGNASMTAQQFANKWINKFGDPTGGQPMMGFLGAGAGADAMSGSQGRGGLLDAPKRPESFGAALRESAKSGALFDGLAQAFNSLRHRPDPYLAQAMQSRLDARRQDGLQERKRQEQASQRQEAARMIGQMGRPDLAQAVAAGILDPGQAYSIASQRQEAPRGVVMGDRLVNPETGEVMADFTGEPMADQGDIGAVRKEYTGLPQTKEMQAAANQFDAMYKSAQAETAAGDVALIYSFMKMLDPTSTVMAGEYATAENTGGVDSKLINLYNRALDGTRLQPDQRAAFLKEAEQRYYARERSDEQTRQQYGGYADNVGGSIADLPEFRSQAGDYAPAGSQRPMPAPPREQPLDPTAAAPVPMPSVSPQSVQDFIATLPPHQQRELALEPNTARRAQMLRRWGFGQ